MTLEVKPNQASDKRMCSELTRLFLASAALTSSLPAAIEQDSVYVRDTITICAIPKTAVYLGGDGRPGALSAAKACGITQPA